MLEDLNNQFCNPAVPIRYTGARLAVSAIRQV